MYEGIIINAVSFAMVTILAIFLLTALACVAITIRVAYENIRRLGK